MTFPYILTDSTLTVIVDGTPRHVERTNAKWDEIKDALSAPDTTSDMMIALMEPVTAVRNAISSNGDIELRGGVLFFKGQQVHNALSGRILDIVNEGFDVLPWIRFTENVYANPADFSRDELYLFLENANLPITSDGCFLAYKNVSQNYTDNYTKTMNNAIGSTVQMPREQVDKDRNNTCSVGLHFCSKDYLSSYGGASGHTMIVKINPADVVSIPSDYDNTKGRTWKYEVVGEIPFEGVHKYNWSAIVDEEWLCDVDDEDWQWDDDEHIEPVEQVASVVDNAPSTKKRFFGWIRNN
jgi:hypothetical protein